MRYIKNSKLLFTIAAFTFAGLVFATEPQAQVVAVVNGEPVPLESLERQLGQLTPRPRSRSAATSMSTA